MNPTTDPKPPGTALITGGDSGIGYALSRRLLADGWHLLWIGRLPQHLDDGLARLRADTSAEAAGRVATLACDLSQPVAAERVHAWVAGRGDAVDLLVNNAGFGSYGLLTEIPLERDLAMLGVNLITPHRLTRLFLADMERRGHGTIVNVASVAALIPLPGFAAYAGTKAFLHQYSRCLDLELRATGSPVRVVTVYPAAVRNTGFQRGAGMQHTGFFTDPTATTPEAVAADICRALFGGGRGRRRVVVSGRMLRWLLPLARLLPDWLLLPRYRRELEAARRGRA